MSGVSKNVYFVVLNDIVDKCNNTFQRTTKMKPIDVKPDTYAEYSVDSNEKDPKFKVSNHVKISKDKNVKIQKRFTKGYTSHWYGKVFVISKIKNTVLWTYLISDLNGEEIVGTFDEKKLQKTNQKEFRIKKVIKRKRNEPNVKWKSYANWFNS